MSIGRALSLGLIFGVIVGLIVGIAAMTWWRNIHPGDVRDFAGRYSMTVYQEVSHQGERELKSDRLLLLDTTKGIVRQFTLDGRHISADIVFADWDDVRREVNSKSADDGW